MKNGLLLLALASIGCATTLPEPGPVLWVLPETPPPAASPACVVEVERGEPPAPPPPPPPRPDPPAPPPPSTDELRARCAAGERAACDALPGIHISGNVHIHGNVTMFGDVYLEGAIRR